MADPLAGKRIAALPLTHAVVGEWALTYEDGVHLHVDNHLVKRRDFRTHYRADGTFWVRTMDDYDDGTQSDSGWQQWGVFDVDATTLVTVDTFGTHRATFCVSDRALAVKGMNEVLRRVSTDGVGLAGDWEAREEDSLRGPSEIALTLDENGRGTVRKLTFIPGEVVPRLSKTDDGYRLILSSTSGKTITSFDYREISPGCLAEPGATLKRVSP